MESDIEKEDATHQVQAAVAALYGAFARYPAPGKMQTRWGVALDSHELARLTTKPLHELQWEHLARYAFKAMSLWGDADDYRHFLPRLLELLVNDPPEYHWGLNEALVLYNIRDEWRHWPLGEQQAIEGYLEALWRYTLVAFDPDKPEGFLQDGPCCIAQLADDLAPYLVAWGTKSSLIYLARYVDLNSVALAQGAGLDNSYWSERRAQERQVLSWLLGPVTLGLLERAYDAYSSEPFASDLTQVVDSLSALRRE